MNGIVKAPPRALAPVGSVAEARHQLESARARLSRQLDAVEATLRPLSVVKRFFERRPLVAVGVAFVGGYLLARLVSGPAAAQTKGHSDE